MKSYDRLFIGGEWVAPSSSSVFDVHSPSTGELVGRTPEAMQADIDQAVAAAREAVDNGPWPHMTPTERGAVLARAAEAIRNQMQDISELISTEMGSPVSWGLLAQVLAPTMILDYYAGLGSTFAFDTVKDGLLGPVLVTKEPIGVVAAITPWNVPLFLAAAKLGPALLSGSSVVFKPAPETPLDANVFAEILADCRPAEGRAQRGPGRPRGRRVPGQPPRGEQGLLHRLDRGRQEDRRRLRGQPQALQPGARRQVGRHPAGRRQPGRVTAADDAQRHHEQRRGLHLADPHPGPPGPLHRGHRCPRRAGPEHEGRRRPRPGHRGRAPGGRAPARPGGGLHPHRPGGGRQGGRRRRPPRRARRPAGSSSPPSSWTWTTRCASPRRRSSARCCRSSPTTTTPTPCGSPTTRTTACAAGSSPPTTTGGSASPARSAPAPTWSTRRSRSTSRRRSGGTRSPGSGREFGEDGLELFLEKKTINLPAGYTPTALTAAGRDRHRPVLVRPVLPDAAVHPGRCGGDLRSWGAMTRPARGAGAPAPVRGPPSMTR